MAVGAARAHDHRLLEVELQQRRLGQTHRGDPSGHHQCSTCPRSRVNSVRVRSPCTGGEIAAGIAPVDGVIGGWIVPAGMFALMFGMGLTLTLADFRRILVIPRPAVVGTLLQVVAMPLAGLGLARAFALEPILAAGLVIVAACPGGLLSNVLCHLGKADTALSITLTATATAITLFTIPLWVRAGLGGATVPGGHVEMPVLHTTLSLGGFTILPLAIGMVARPVWPGLAAREAWVTRASTFAVILALSVSALRRDDPPVAALATSWQPALLLLASALAMGLGVPLLLRVGWRDAVTIAVELCIKNGVVGLFVATRSLGSLEAGAPVGAVMALQVPVAMGALALYRIRQSGGPTPREIP